MRFLAIYRTAEKNVPPSTEEITAMGKLIDEMTHAGVLLATEGCLPSVTGARVRRSNGRITVTDGPFTESKEIIGGFALIQVRSKEEAVEWTKRFLRVAGDGESEIRQIAELDDCGPAVTPDLRAEVERQKAKLAFRQ
jgi:hypothetical protein